MRFYVYFLTFNGPAGESPLSFAFSSASQELLLNRSFLGIPPRPHPDGGSRRVWCSRETPVSGAACTSGRHRELSALDLATTYTLGTKPPPRMGTADTLWSPFGSPRVLLWAAAAPNTTRLPTYAHEGVRDTGQKV